jgi:hypothetical protein
VFIGLPVLRQSMLVPLNTSQSSTCIPCSHQPAFQLLQHHYWDSINARNSSGVFIGLPGLCPSQLVTSYASQSSTCIPCSHQPAFQLLQHNLWASTDARNSSGVLIDLPALCQSMLVPLNSSQSSTCICCSHQPAFQLLQHYL